VLIEGTLRVGPSVLFVLKAPFFVSFLRELRTIFDHFRAKCAVWSIEMGASSHLFFGLFSAFRRFFCLFTTLLAKHICIIELH
jgi:hypothetical protein